jgi:hypothetical protein
MNIPNCVYSVDTIEIKPRSKITPKQQLSEIDKESGILGQEQRTISNHKIVK